MTIASSNILSWPPQDPEYASESSTLVISPEECPYPVVSPDATEYVRLIEEQNREYALLGEKLLREVVDRIRRLAPLEVDGETRKLLDAAIEHQETAQCDDVEGWASRLAADVKDADD